MRLAETLSVLKRRWYVVLAGLLLTATGCYYIYAQVPATYEAKGSVVLMPPSSTVGDEGNPYLFLGGMGQALDVLTRHVNAAEIVEPVLDDYPDTSYTIEPDRDTSGSIIQVVATGSTPDATMDVLAAALQTIPVSLDAMQDELAIEDYLRIGLMTVVVDTEPTVEQKQRVQLLIFAAAGGSVGTLLFAGMLDGLVLSLRRRKADRPSTPAEAENAEPLRNSSARERARQLSGEEPVADGSPTVPVPTARRQLDGPAGPLPKSQASRKRRTVRIPRTESDDEAMPEPHAGVGAFRS